MINNPAGISSSYMRQWDRALRSGNVLSMVKVAVLPLASLRLTVTLFSMTLFLVWVGTVAQQDKGMWQVIQNYFHCWVAWIEFGSVFPRAFFQSSPAIYEKIAPSGGFFFPGGISLGLALFVNLIAAHAVRFQSVARGKRLVAGIAAMAVAVAICIIVILSGHSQSGLQGKPPMEWTTLWQVMKTTLVLLWLTTSVAGGVHWYKRGFPMTLGPALAVVGCLVWGGISLALLISQTQISASSMRILWQLTQASVCGVTILLASLLIFGRRAGIVTLHVGVGLLMFGELLVSIAAVEEQISLGEGETVNYGQDIRSVELAVIDSSPKDADRVTAIPLTHKESPTSWLRSRTIAHHHFPFAIEIVSYFPNAELVDIPAGSKNPATAGIGRHFMAKPIRSSGGAGESEVDLAAAYVRLRQTESGEDLGTYLISQVASLQDRSESVSVDGQNFRLFLRFRRNPKQYQVTLLDVRKDDYIGTDIPQNYSSDVRLAAEKLDFDTELHISMNNPVRFAGETLYQSGYNFDPQTGKESSTIQVVTNIGWMIPYVACGIVMVGMLAQFSLTLLRFLQRQDRPTRRVGSRISLIWIGAGAALGLLLIVPRALPQRTTQDEFHLAEFGILPVAYEGRVKPLDTVARTSLRFISGKETIAAEGPKDKTSAIEWLTDVIAEVDHADEHRIFKIDNRDLLFTLKLRPRKRNRFSLAEIEPQMGVFREQVRLAQAAEESENTSQTAYHRKAIELNSKIQLYFGLRESFRILDEDLSTTDAFVAAERITRLAEIVQSLNDAQVPYAVPAFRDSRKESRLWEPLIVASSRRWAKSLLGGSNQPAAVAAYADQLVRGIQRDDKRLAQVVRSRMLAMIQEIRGQQMGGAISRADAEAALDRMPAETRLSVEQSLREKVIRELDGVRVSLTAAIRSLSGSQNDPTNDRIAEGYERALAAFRDKDIATFNSETTRLISVVSESQPKDLKPAKVRFESYFNHVSPFVVAIPIYLIALIIATIGLLPRATPFRWTAMGLILITFGFHTLALMGRVYISGRPPVTNLYSVAIFIAWGCVLLGLVFELFFRVGVGNLMATVSAPFGLLIAHILSTEVPSHAGDTMKVMQAVLDTQFWLSTHVIIVTFGYVATVVAGLFGLIAVCYACITRFFGKDRKVLDLEESTEWSVGGVFKTLIYATLCIGIFLSFVGTVLGGLWADDSWGRFWGWDPKENGALMIVLWTALVLHARWGGLVQNRGLAVLAVAGNLMVGWSMFGVNELGVGLHSYGFTEGVLFGLGLWWIFNLIGIGVGLLIPRWAYQ